MRNHLRASTNKTPPAPCIRAFAVLFCAGSSNLPAPTTFQGLSVATKRELPPLGCSRRLEAARHCEGFASVLGTLELSGWLYVRLDGHMEAYHA